MVEQVRRADGETARGPRSQWLMDSQLQDIQPGGGVIIRLEQHWGRLRRLLLKVLFRGDVKRMAGLRKGDFKPVPHKVLDPRDLKFLRNQGGWYWDEQDNPDVWRDGLPFARVGLAERIVVTFCAAAASAPVAGIALRVSGAHLMLWWLLSVSAAVVGILIAWFFRIPRSLIPFEPGGVVSPADGKVVEIENPAYDEHIGGPAKKMGIFLSILNVQINRSSIAGRVIGLKYRIGKCLKALRPESDRENEQLPLYNQALFAPYRGMVVRQITGVIAGLIECWLKPGDTLIRRAQFGMIKLGSRRELVLPTNAGLVLRARVGDTVQAGTTVMGVYGVESASGAVVPKQ